MSATKQKPTIESLISIGFAVVIVIGIAPVIFWQQDREQPSAPVNDEQLKPEILQLHVVEGPKPSETPTIAAETPPTQEYDTDLPANLLDGAVAKVYEVAEQDPNAGNRLMRELADSVIKESSLDEQTAWVESLPDGLLKGTAAAQVIQHWGKKDVRAAADWALSLDQGARAPALSAAFGKWGAGVGGADRKHGAEMIEELENKRDRDFALNGYVSGLVHSDAELALELAGSISNPQLRKGVITRLTAQIARNKQERAQ